MAVGLPETITAANGLGPAEVIAWVRETSHEHFARPGIGFDDLWGSLADSH